MTKGQEPALTWCVYTCICVCVCVAGALVANTQLLRALLAHRSSPAARQHLSAWLLLWLEVLAISPLAAAGGAVKADLPAVLGALLDEQAGRAAVRTTTPGRQMRAACRGCCHFLTQVACAL